MDTGDNMPEIMIQPLPVGFECYDSHVILYLKGHKDYECIEAMIRDNPAGEPHIRAILTFHGGLQVEHINDEAYAGAFIQDKKTCRIVFTPIKYVKKIKKRTVEIHLEFKSYRNEEIVFHLVSAGKAKSSGTGLINPGGRSRQLSLPIMHREKSAIAGKGSYLTINGRQCDIPVIVNIPLLFKGFKGYYSEQFNIAAFRAGTENVRIITYPLKITPEEKWVYEYRNKKEAYHIAEISGSEVTLLGDACTINAVLYKDNILIRKISYHSQSTKPEFSITFTPSVPVFSKDEIKVPGRYGFSLSIDRHEALVSGLASAGTSKGCFLLDLLPLQPDWAAERPVHILIRKLAADQFNIKTEIAKYL